MSEFPRQWAMGVIDRMQKYFGARFDNAYPKRQGMSEEQYMEDLISTCCEVLEGITADQIKYGMDMVKRSKFCPVFPELREWCEEYVRSSYKPKLSALANINAWLSDTSTLITNAEREAYNRVYDAFNQMQWASNHEKAKYHAYESFKEVYSEVVKELVAKGEVQSIWVEPLKIENSKKSYAMPRDYLNINLTDEQKIQSEKDGERVKQLVSEGMTIGAAYMQIMKEKKAIPLVLGDGV